MSDEQLKVTEAWEYFKNKTGVEIERRAFFWLDRSGLCENQWLDVRTRLESNQSHALHQPRLN